MKKIRRFLSITFFVIIALISIDAAAQCSMCTLNAESSVKNGQTEGKGLNKAVLYLLAAPYVAVAAIGFLWYKKYRRRNIPLHMKNEKIHLN